MLPVHVAALNGHTDCMKRLLSAMPQLNIDITDDCGRTCLHGAACSGYVHAVILNQLICHCVFMHTILCISFLKVYFMIKFSGLLLTLT